jgi:T5orf172 domain
MAVGYVYILSNSAMGKLLRIGFTCGSVERRARELSGATGVPGAFVVEYFHISVDVEEIESLVHAELNGLRYSENREFF